MKAVRTELKDNQLVNQPVEIAGRWPGTPACGHATASILTVSDHDLQEIPQVFANLHWVEAGKHPRRSLTQVLLQRARRHAGLVGTRARYDGERAVKKSLAALLRNSISSGVRAAFLVAVPQEIFELLWGDARLQSNGLTLREHPREPGPRATPHTPLAEIVVPPELELQFLGKAPAVQRVRQLILLAAQKPTATVVILGEPGTGKDLVANAIHRSTFGLCNARGLDQVSPPYVNVDLNTLPVGLFESVLYGHKKGAFTGALENQCGRARAAEGGTLVLNEIGDVLREVQGKLLRFMETKSVLPVGALEEVAVHARVIVATNKNLDRLVQKGLFRADLWGRILMEAIPILIPALRDHKEDIPLLAQELWKRRTEDPHARLSAEVLDELTLYNWPNNVRELDSVLFRLLVEFGDRNLGREHVRRVLYLTGGRTTLTPPEPSVDSFITFKLDCLRHLMRVAVIVRACKVALRPVFKEGRRDAETARQLNALLKGGPFADLELSVLNPLLFGSEKPFQATLQAKKKLTELLNLLETSPAGLQHLDAADLKQHLDAALSALFQEQQAVLTSNLGGGPQPSAALPDLLTDQSCPLEICW